MSSINYFNNSWALSALKKDKTIYVLKLEHDKYYIGKSSNIPKRVQKHQEGKGSEWTKKYKPLDCYYYDGCDIFDEDKITKMYMTKYGIDNVRGGSYCHIILSDNEKEFLQREIRHMEDMCLVCGKKGHMANKCRIKDPK
jgi:predicted GIY-YIG superfamily endonuclease